MRTEYSGLRWVVRHASSRRADGEVRAATNIGGRTGFVEQASFVACGYEKLDYKDEAIAKEISRSLSEGH